MIEQNLAEDWQEELSLMIVVGRLVVLSEEALLSLTEDEVAALDISLGVVTTTK